MKQLCRPLKVCVWLQGAGHGLKGSRDAHVRRFWRAREGRVPYVRARVAACIERVSLMETPLGLPCALYLRQGEVGKGRFTLASCFERTLLDLRNDPVANAAPMRAIFGRNDAMPISGFHKKSHARWSI